MLAFALEGPTHRREGLCQRKNIGGNEHICVRGSYRMPVDAKCRYCNLRHQISARKCDAFRGETPERNAADHPVLFPDLAFIQEATEIFGLAVIGDGRRQSHPEPFPASAIHTLPRAQPGARAPMAVMELRGRTVKADLQRQTIACQGTERLEPPPSYQHPVGEHRSGRRGEARSQYVADVCQQKRLTTGHEDFTDAYFGRFAGDPPDAGKTKLSPQNFG